MSGRIMRCALSGAAFVALAVFVAPAHAVPAVPAQFMVEDAVPGAGFVVPVAMTFLPDGRMFVAEKRGRVYEVRNGVKMANPLWSAENEILNNGDRGLLSIAIDPDYYRTHWIYLLYTVDPDTSGGNDTDDDAFGRLTRYTVNFTDSATVDPASRTILMGASWRLGAVSGSTSHTVGALRWGRDSSLIASIGDGAQFNSMDEGGQDGGAFGPNKTDPFEDIGSFRSQYIGSLAGKMLRINRRTGHGFASNPYVDGNLGSIQSRVWCYGVRNTYRFTLRPGTGNPDTTAGNPGTIYMGEVGWNDWEEMNVARTGGLNFGWPCYEGMGTQPLYQDGSPSHNGCGTFGTPSNPAQASPPLATWHHYTDDLSIPPGFHGNTSTGGVFYTSNQYPVQYRNQYFFGDYGQNWVKVAVVDGNDNLVSILPFGTAMDGPVDFALDPITGNVFYVAINVGQVRRIRWTGQVGGDTPPVASATATPMSGTAPLQVAFSAAGSTDADGDPLSYSWLFGDGGSATGITANHTYVNPGILNAQVTVSDGRGGVDIRSLTISVNAPGSTFPSTAVLDDFNRPNGAIGGFWVDNTSGLTIDTNKLAQTATTNSAVWNGAIFGPRQEVYINFTAASPGADEQNLMLKVQGTSWNTGHIELAYDAGNSRVSVATYAPGQGWVGRGNTPVTFGPGDQFGARTDSLGNLTIYKNGAQVGNVFSLANWPFNGSGGRVGLTLTGTSGSQYDNFGGGNVVSNANTKPTATILTPSNNSFYIAGQAINCTGDGSDTQTPSNNLTYDWIVDLIHNTHIHPATYSFSGKTGSFPAENHDDGTGVHFEIKLAVTDPGGLTDTARVSIWPETDLQPSAVTVTPDPPVTTQSAQYDFKLYNRGRLPAPISHWVLRAGSNLIGQGDAIVPALDSVSVSVAAASPAAGTYTLRLVADSLGAVFETNESNNASVRALTVNPLPGNNPPVAVAGGSPQSGQAPLTVNFSGAGSSDPNGDPLTYSWTFGDGGSGSGLTTSHPYVNAGNFAAILTVNDGRGGIDTASVAVAVSAPPNTFPQTAILDNFNRANGAIGGSWVDVTSGLVINANQLAQTAASNSVVWNGGTFGTAQEAYVTIAVAAAAPEQNLMLKVQGTSWSAGHIEVAYNVGSGRVFVNTYAPSQGWVGRGSVLATYASGDRFGARCDAAGNVTIYKNAVQLASISAGNWPFVASGGRIGFTLTGVAATRWDDFGGGTFVGPAPPAASTQPREEILMAPPGHLALSNAYPNPSSGAVSFALDLPQAGAVAIGVYDVQGRVVWRAPSREYGAGRWTLGWDGRATTGARAAAGLYFIRVEAAGTGFMRRVAMIE